MREEKKKVPKKKLTFLNSPGLILDPLWYHLKKNKKFGNKMRHPFKWNSAQTLNNENTKLYTI